MKGKKRRQIGIVALMLSLIMTMMPLSVSAAESYSGTVSRVDAYASYNCIELEWPKVSGATSYKIYDHANNQIVNTWTTNKTYFEAPVSDEYYHQYRVHAIKGNDQSPYFAVSTAKTKVLGIHYNIKVKKKTTLKCKHCGKKFTLRAGQALRADEFSMGCYRKAYLGEHRFDFKRIRLKGINASKQYDSNNYYSGEEITRYVNKRGLTSKTNRMVVVSTRCQHLYLFTKASNGKWVLDQGPWMVATGKPTTPTPQGQTTIKRKWSRHNGQRFWSATPTFSFHTNAKSWGALGKPKSGGCVRNTTDHAKYIYYNYKVKTRVCVI